MQYKVQDGARHRLFDCSFPKNLHSWSALFGLRCLQMATTNRWLRPEVFPLFAAVGVAVGICGMQLIRNITSNPEVRVNKEKRAAGVLENFTEGERYAEHGLRKFVRNKSPEIMPALNSFFTKPN